MSPREAGCPGHPLNTPSLPPEERARQEHSRGLWLPALQVMWVLMRVKIRTNWRSIFITGMSMWAVKEPSMAGTGTGLVKNRVLPLVQETPCWPGMKGSGGGRGRLPWKLAKKDVCY